MLNSNELELYADRLLAADLASDWDGRKPPMAVALLAAHDCVKLLLQRFGDGADRAFADLDLIDRTDRGDLRGGAGEERLIGDVEHLARNHLLDNWNAQVAGDLQHRVARDPRQHGVAQRSGNQLVVLHQEQVLTRALADEAADVERDAFHVAVDDGFHLYELRVHVVGPGLGHGGQRVGRQPRPRRDAHVAAFALPAQILSPRIIDDVNLGGRVERVHAGLTIYS